MTSDAAGGDTDGSPPHLRVADVVGAPMLPPPALVSLTERVRAGLAACRRRLAPPPVLLLEGLFGVLDHAALGALCSLEIPDALDGPVPVDELARRLDAEPELVRRLVGYGSARGWLRLDRRGRVRPTRLTRFMRRDHPGGWRAWVEFATGSEVTAALGQLAIEPRVADAFVAANAAPFFDWHLAHPDRHRAFDAAMAAGGRLHGLVLSSALDWSSTSRVCDVGGGTGALLTVLLERHSHLHGVLVDLPSVVGRARAHHRLEVIAGDAFTEIPTTCDTYLFVNVLHDWDDADAVGLVQQVPVGARAVIVEGERSIRPADSITARTDLLMLALAPGGRERTTTEFERLAARAGRQLRRTIRLASGDRAHIIS